MVRQSEACIAFLAIRPTKNDDGYLGAVLVTDSDGIPVEFRCTHPLRPTTPQKALYGEALKSHIFNKLIGGPLLHSITSDPLFCAVEDPAFLPLADGLAIPIVYVQRHGEMLSVAKNDTDRSDFSENPKRIDSERNGFQPISVSFHRGHEQEFESIHEGLQQIFNQIDLFEPFERITTAITVLVERDKNFS